ncbi:uncharacterized protein LOC119729235 isoform X1 [Patiria miniata]|uniref:A-kinase anchor protein 7-like phosphoesterase domain-containing protein n=1 Tax=Patiria miniata TaxID=46514 RepID=A0A914A2Y8_PATMI|nr:uncharacterized protein LOC119729235 isoform X1 [Patiria miniata]XP_038057747.1 uncharacterized protein LOC119729235 isoform X1 [Patiria miniata]XP_038057748.1 uncharacterized protein LOC119729235 isoform X1 [Patiria miniata]
MSQAYGRMYHPTPHHHTHHHPPHHQVHSQGPPYRPSGESPPHPGGYPHRGYHQNHYGSPPPRPGPSHYNNTVSVYSVPKPSRPYNNYSNRRGRSGGNTGRGGYHNNHNNHHHSNHNGQGYNNHAHNSYRPHPPDFDLEWDHYDFNAEKPKGKQTSRQRNSYSQHGGGPTLADAELEWDDYDLRPKEEEEEETVETLDYILTEGVFPLIGVVTKAPLSRGHIPLGAIQVCRFPQGGASFKTLASSDHLSKSLRLNKELLVLTSELNEGALFSSGLDSPSESKDFLLADLALTRDKDSSSSATDTPSKDGESEGASNGISEEDLDEDFLNDTYESGYQDRLGDIDLYALAPHDFDSPDSTFSRSLADLTDISLYEELGIDPSLLRHTLERSRSLGDATRAQDASKDRSLKGLKAKKRKRKGTEKVEESSAAAGDEGSERKTKRLAPNFFVAVQVSNPQIHEALKDVQQTVVSGDEKLKDAMVPISTLHLTIMVMHLATEEDVERAKVALNECHRLLSPRFIKEKLSILFGGLGHFNNQVMFAKIKDQDNILESLYEIADTVEKCFSEYQLVSTGERGFKPHLTVMKLSRAPSLRKKGVRRIKSELYKAHSSQVFGTQVVEGLQLCSINKPKTPDGYYCKAAEVFFGDPTCRPDRDIHTIAEGEEPAIESLNEACSSATNMSESTDTRSSPKRVLETEEKMDCNDGEASVKTQISDSPKYEHMSSNEKQNISLDVKHQSSSRPICESVVNNENSVSKAEVQKGVCLDSDTTQDTPSGATSDTPFASLSDTGHNGPSDTADSTLENMSGGITSDTTPTSLSDVSAIEPSALLNGERKSTESAMDCGTVQRGPGDVLKTGPTETC